MSPSETAVGAITPLPLCGRPPGSGCAHSPPMTVARTVLPMLPRAQVGSASDRRRSRASRLKFGNPTAFPDPAHTALRFAPGARRPSAHHDLAIRACHDNLRRSRALGPDRAWRQGARRGGVGMLVLIDATPEGKKLLRGRR
jgi:hypothetical protein